MKIKRVVLWNLLVNSCIMAQDMDPRVKDIHNAKEMDMEKSHKYEMKDKKTKTGILAGIELGLGGGNGNGKVRQENIPFLTPGYTHYDITPFIFNTKVFGGYQKYFGKDEKLGFNVKGSLGVGYLHHKFDNTKTIVDDGKVEGKNPSYDFATSYMPLSFGVEANFLYDFWERNEHTLGLNVGLGYSFVYGINTNITPLPDIGLSSSVLNGITDKNIYYSLISPKVGIHYYYGRHQLEFNFSFDTAFGETKNVNVYDLMPSVKGVKLFFITNPNYFYTFNLSYAYRF
ncbi:MULTISPECIES: hypothetical protein [unclassified Helicobacter]|uniref:hypothetical protein n=1 Tax=unclassified Helicobacter TaxID=2593540 RepID=UPI000CF03102|nr:MULTISPECIES: hypothetical protein [unclassified Helicobacter]